MRKALMTIAVAAIALGVAPVGAHHEDSTGFETCDYAHDEPHYGLWRDNPEDPTQWVQEGDPNRPWVGSTSPTGAVYAGMFGGSEGNAWLSAGTCLEHQGAGSHGGTTEANVYETEDGYAVVVVVEGGNDDPGANGYIGANTGYDRNNGRANSGGPLCAGAAGAGECTPVDTPVMCEPASSAGGPPPSEGGANWHSTDADGCDLRQ